MKIRTPSSLRPLPLVFLALAACGDETPVFGGFDVQDTGSDTGSDGTGDAEETSDETSEDADANGDTTDAQDTGDATDDTDPDAPDAADADDTADAGPVCGNGVVEPGEACDGTALAGQTCATEGFATGDLACAADCALDTSGCEGVCEPQCGARVCGPDPLCGQSCGACDDGFVCTTAGACEPESTGPGCGNGALDEGELCDGALLGANTCERLGFDGGVLACGADCGAWDLSACTGEPGPDPVCGNGVAEAGEACDGSDVRGATCAAFGFDFGALGCLPSCGAIVSTACTDTPPAPVCGNGRIESGEICDGPALGGTTCDDLGYDGGDLGCNGTCAGYDTSLCETACVPACDGRLCGPDPVCGTSCGVCPATSTCDAAGACVPNCGNGIIDAGEVCDGTNFAGATCGSLGFARGDLACDPTCGTLVTADCEPVCVPFCGARECGNDIVCGTSCGTCEAPAVCATDGICEVDGSRAPYFVRLTSTVSELSEGGTVTFEAIVNDPNGLDDLRGGTLRDPFFGGIYGVFEATATPGRYVLELTWAQVHAARAINFTGPVNRTFEAAFVDAAANEGVLSIDVTLTCNSWGACDGVCTSLNTPTDCGGCDIACADGSACNGGVCDCAAGLTYCDGTCTDLASSDFCGDCATSCNGGAVEGLCLLGDCYCPAYYQACGTGCVASYSVEGCGPACTLCGTNDVCSAAGCSAPAAGDVRLSPAGVAEFFDGVQWGSICRFGFNFDAAAVLCRQLGLEFESLESRIDTGEVDFAISNLGCTGAESSIAACVYSTDTSACGTGDHMIVHCGDAAACDPTTTRVVINELFANPTGEDGTNEFIELRSDLPWTDLSDLELVFYNGAVSTEYLRVPLAGTTDERGYFVLGGSTVPELDQLLPAAIQNGPDFVQLVDCRGAVVDALGYGAVETINTFGEGLVAPATSGQSIGRDNLMTDSGDNLADFLARATTPGAPNDPVSCGGGGIPFGFTGVIGVGSPSGMRPGEFCGEGPTSDRFGYAQELWINNDPCSWLLEVHADWSGDGFLAVYDTFYDRVDPLSRCLSANDDWTTIYDSEVSFIVVPPFGSVVFLMTTSEPETSVSYVVTVTGTPL